MTKSESAPESELMTAVNAQAGDESLPAVRSDPGGIRWLYNAQKSFLKLFFRIYLRLEARGVDHLPPQGPALILCTHSSIIDPLLVGSILKREAHFLARTGVVNLPLIRTLMRYNNVHPIRRGGIDREAIRICRSILEARWPLIMFPEGTRSFDGIPRRPKGGFAMMIDDADDLPCIAVCIRGSHRAMRRGTMIPLPRKVVCEIGSPFRFAPRTDGERRRDYFERCADRLLDEWNKLDPQTD